MLLATSHLPRKPPLLAAEVDFAFSQSTEGILHDRPLNLPRLALPVRRADAFTLIELLVVITIIVVLIGLLLPVVGKIRIASQAADTKNWVNQLGSAIDRYQQDFHAYPGPLANNEIDLQDTAITYPSGGYTSFSFPAQTAVPGFDVSSEMASQASKNFTMAENLVLGLLGGLHQDATTATQLDYDPTAVGGGAYSLSTVGIRKRYTPYLDGKQLSWKNNSYGMSGHFIDDSGQANDCIIPCFVDRFTDPMPILYMRAKVGANPSSGAVTGDTDYGDNYNPVVTDDFSETSAQYSNSSPIAYAVRAGQYDISQIIAYTGSYSGSWPGMTRDLNTPPTSTSIGIGKTAKSGLYTTPPTGNNLYHGLQMAKWTAVASAPTMTKGASPPYVYPYDAYPYLIGSNGTVRQKDGYILISAGADRTYGTEDDICNFGTVGD